MSGSKNKNAGAPANDLPSIQDCYSHACMSNGVKLELRQCLEGNQIQQYVTPLTIVYVLQELAGLRDRHLQQLLLP